jgi:hypothetical protein
MIWFLATPDRQRHLGMFEESYPQGPDGRQNIRRQSPVDLMTYSSKSALTGERISSVQVERRCVAQ